jgi:drug/metabolite transporter (DMT)-like permease
VSSRAWAAFATVSLLWGIPYLFIKVAVDDGLPPAFIAWSRVVLAAVVLVVISWRAGILGPLRGRGRWLAAYALLEIAIPFPLIAAGEQHVSSGLTAILIASVPLIIALLALRFDAAERATGRRLVGLLLGFTGVIALVGVDLAGDSKGLLGAGAIAIASFCYAAGAMVLKRHLADLDPRATMGAVLAMAAVVLTPVAALDLPTRASITTDSVIAIVVLGLLCTAAALVVMAMLVAEVGPGKALVITYVNPVVAVALGVAVLGERPGAGAIAGLLLILAGSWLSTDGRLPPWLTPRRSGSAPSASRTPRHSAPRGRAMRRAARAGRSAR